MEEISEFLMKWQGELEEREAQVLAAEEQGESLEAALHGSHADASAEAPFRRPAARGGVAGRSAWVGRVGAIGLPSSEASRGGRCWVSRDPAWRGPASAPESEASAGLPFG